MTKLYPFESSWTFLSKSESCTIGMHNFLLKNLSGLIFSFCKKKNTASKFKFQKMIFLKLLLFTITNGKTLKKRNTAVTVETGRNIII